MGRLTPWRRMSGLNEFDEIARLFRPLTRGAAGAFDLADDAAVVSHRPGHDLVITKDALVEGVHFLSGEAPHMVARKLLRVNLSDLAAKGAEPFGCFLAVAWPSTWQLEDRESFANGLAADLEVFDLSLLGGDTVSTPGPFTASITALGWVPQGGMIRRAGARPGDLVLVSGTIGDATLGLAALRGDVDDPGGGFVRRFRLPEPPLDLREGLRKWASAAADVSDGLVADARHIANASGVRLTLNLDRIPISVAAANWLEQQADSASALVRLATGGDDYEVICTLPTDAPAQAGLTVIGEVCDGAGVEARVAARTVDTGTGGWRHR